MLSRPWFLSIADAALVNACIVGVFAVRFLGDIPERNIIAYAHTWFYITAIFVVIFYVQGMYDRDENDDDISIFFKALWAVTLGVVSLTALTFVSRAFAFPRTVILISYFVMIVAFGLLHILAHRSFLARLPRRRVVVYGAEDRLEHIDYCLNLEERRYVKVKAVPVGRAEEVQKAFGDEEADCAIIADGVDGARELAFELFLRHPGAMVYLLPEVSDIIAGAQHRTVLGDMPLIAMAGKTIVGRYYLMKRVMDLAVAAAGVVCLMPLFVLVGLGIKLTSRGPVFYSQDRVGRGGRLFRIIKFRTMIQGAEEPTGPVLAAKDDPRVTAIGRWLRRLKIDEMPQLINVIRGEMSLVGPRPERPEFVAEFEKTYPAYVFRRLVMPGITGLAQVNGKYETDPSLKLKYDLIYIYNYRPTMDFAIIYQTFQFVLRENI